MLFNSLEFLFFFPIVTLLYFLISPKYRWFHLLVASCIFYSAFIPIYIFILFFTIIIDYIAGILIENSKDKRKKKQYLIVSIITNLGILVVFKYYNFFIDNLNALFYLFDFNPNCGFLQIILPIGLSFHTFQAMSYTIEVYRGNQKAERHLGIYALYVMYFPQLVAGPIERPQNLLFQFHQTHTFDYLRITNGLRLMAWGMFKKVVIADRLALFVNTGYDNLASYSGLSMLIIIIFFSFQIYCDFSGYSDIAIGASQIIGIRLMQNFKQPYLSSSIDEFWKRWHISLSTWFKDYLYIPLGGNRLSISRWCLNLLIVFLISGLWHGASWTFIVWGLLHGTYLIFMILLSKPLLQLNNFIKPKTLIVIKTIITFSLVSLTWVFFRAKSVSDGFYVVKSLFTGWGELVTNIFSGKPFAYIFLLRQSKFDFILSVVLIVLLVGVDLFHSKNKIQSYILKLPFWQRWMLYFTVLFIIVFYGIFDNKQFIYFQF